jgi:hypothetical protein
MSHLDPRIGTWKLNVAKSKFSPVFSAIMQQAPPKEETMVYRELGTDEYEMTMTGVLTDGKPLAVKGIVPREGGTVKILQGDLPPGFSVVATKIDPSNSYATFMLNGKQLFVGQSLVSEDGKTMRVTDTGTDAQGKAFEHLLIFDKL